MSSALERGLLTCRGGSEASRPTTWTPSCAVVTSRAQWSENHARGPPQLGHVTSQGALGESFKLQASVFPSVRRAAASEMRGGQV